MLKTIGLQTTGIALERPSKSSPRSGAAVIVVRSLVVAVPLVASLALASAGVAQGLSVGGENGINAGVSTNDGLGVSASVGGASGVNADANVGGGGGVAGANASVGGAGGVNASAGVGSGSGGNGLGAM